MSIRRTLDTDVITLRRVFAIDPNTNAPYPSGSVLGIGANGDGSFLDPLQISSIFNLSTSVANIPSTVSTNVSIGIANLGTGVIQIIAGTNISVSNGGTGIVTVNASGSGSIPDPLTLNSLNISSITGSGSPNLISINGAPFANKQGQVTIVNTDTSVTITDVNIRATSVIMVTPLTEISDGLLSEFQNYWITLTPSTSWTINLSQRPTVDISFMYFIASY